MAKHVGHSGFKAGFIVHVLAVLVTKRFLIKLAEQMKWFDTHVSAVVPRLRSDQRFLTPLCRCDVFDGVIDNLMGVLPSKLL